MRPLFEDNHLLVLCKTAGLLTQPSGTDQDSLETQAKTWLKAKYAKPGNVFLEAVHRLDKPASGVVVFAKTSKALSRLNQSIRDKNAKKDYYALVEGTPKELEGTLEHYLIHDDFKASVVAKSHPNAKASRLHYRVVEKKKEGTLLAIDLETGRYHQIRAQLSAIGCPIVGDRKYGSEKVLVQKEAIALHHIRLTIAHPVTKEPVTFEAPLPGYFD